jgi:2-oxoglutarate ferredoxin oxidoreductase subunit alpha
MMRGGPGLGNIMATQGDYNQAAKGGGTGDYHVITLAPNSVQEAADLTRLAFELSDCYRNPAMVLGDGIIGQMMELVEFDDPIEIEDLPSREWALTGCKGREPNIIGPYNSALDLENHNLHLQRKYKEIEEHEQRSEEYLCEDAEYLITAFGSYARIAKEAVNTLRAEGIKIGLFRPITLYPFPCDMLLKTVKGKKAIIDIEGNAGMMARDILLYSKCSLPVFFYGRMGGSIAEIDDLLINIRNLIESGLKKWGGEEYNGKWETL